MIKLDIVVPFYNEEACVEQFLADLFAFADEIEEADVRLILVDDGSVDSTGKMLDKAAASNASVSVIHLWGNHGHQKALIAGIDASGADWLLMLDGDGQHPVSAAKEMVDIATKSSGVDVVQGVRSGKQKGWLKNATSRFFYWACGKLAPELKIIPGASDFRVVHRRAVELILRYPDRHRNLRLLIASLRLNTVLVPYCLAGRLGGHSKYSFRRMLSLAIDGWVAYSYVPLRLSLVLASVTGGIGAVYLVYSLIAHFLGRTVAGWTSLMVFMSFFFSCLFIFLAVVAEYLSRIYEDVRAHPIYSVKPEGSRTFEG